MVLCFDRTKKVKLIAFEIVFPMFIFKLMLFYFSMFSGLFFCPTDFVNLFLSSVFSCLLLCLTDFFYLFFFLRP